MYLKLLPIQFFFFLSLFKVRQDVGKTLNTFWSETLLSYTDSVSTPYFLHSYTEMKEVELVWTWYGVGTALIRSWSFFVPFFVYKRILPIFCGYLLLFLFIFVFFVDK